MPQPQAAPRNFQQMLLSLQAFWSDYGCVLVQPYPSEVGAGTFNPATFLRALGPEPWNVAYVEPSRRPKDGRYGENPNRIQNFYQYQVLLKPVPDNVLELYEKSLEAMGIDLAAHDLRYVVDDWESPTLGAWGLGWEVWLDGMEITQFTYFQQVGSIDLDPVSAELTYGIERLGTYLQSVNRIMDLQVSTDYTWSDLQLETEREFCAFNFEEADVPLHFRLFNDFEAEAKRLLEKGLVAPGYDYVIKCSHAFNMLEARGAISVTERTGYIGRVRNLSRLAARSYLAQRERLGFPLEKNEPRRLRLVAEAEERRAKAAAKAAGKGSGGGEAGGDKGKRQGKDKRAGRDKGPGQDKRAGQDKSPGQDKAPGRDKSPGQDKAPGRDKDPGRDKAPGRAQPQPENTKRRGSPGKPDEPTGGRS